MCMCLCEEVGIFVIVVVSFFFFFWLSKSPHKDRHTFHLSGWGRFASPHMENLNLKTYNSLKIKRYS